MLHYKEKREKLVFIIGLHNKPQGCGASVASAAGSFKAQNCFGGTLCQLLQAVFLGFINTVEVRGDELDKGLMF
jgi:hypothetical protein